VNFDEIPNESKGYAGNFSEANRTELH
jgi:hypothetical protein